MTKDKIEILSSIIDELNLEHRKIEFGSVVERLQKRVTKIESEIELIKIILKKNYEQ
tara:strand:- start:409 stop:579 length:171 start_codon:yes stop_codon:yes gene_type:complete